MADVGKSQSRQIGNNGNSPAGQTGYPTGSSGNAYYEFGSVQDAAFRPSRNLNLQSPSVTPAGSGSHQAANGGGEHYAELAARMDPNPARTGHSGSLFGGKTGSGGTQADAGTLPIPTGGAALTTHFLMRARDPDCGPQPSYVYWAVINTPDTTGAQYTGSRCGPNPLVEIVVEITWKQ
jgi:hypothetical protein